MILSRAGEWLFAVNAGSNQISRFRVGESSIGLTAVVRSRGSFPVSLTQHGDLLYVLNAGARPNIQGFRLREDGGVVRITGSKRFLASDVAPGGLAEAPLQVGFMPDGRHLYSLNTGRGTVGMFRVRANGHLVFLGDAGALPGRAGLQGTTAR